MWREIVALSNPYKSRKTRLTWGNYLRLSLISSCAVCVIRSALHCSLSFYLWCHFSKWRVHNVYSQIEQDLRSSSGQAESQVDPSFQLVSTNGSVWPALKMWGSRLHGTKCSAAAFVSSALLTSKHAIHPLKTYPADPVARTKLHSPYKGVPPMVRPGALNQGFWPQLGTIFSGQSLFQGVIKNALIFVSQLISPTSVPGPFPQLGGGLYRYVSGDRVGYHFCPCWHYLPSTVGREPNY